MPSKTKNPLAEAMRELKADPTPAARPVVRTTLAGKAKPRRGEGTRIIAGHFDVAVHQQLRVLAAQERNTVQGLLHGLSLQRPPATVRNANSAPHLPRQPSLFLPEKAKKSP